ncbi:MAG: glycosyltransferase [Phycisphaerae bacterium]|nr:glycosyltransferase [Gemmatimonadaceae bacterium]
MMGLRDHVRARGARCSVINVTRHRQADHDDLYFPASAPDVLKRIRALRPDIVHIHFGGNLFARQAALFIMLSAMPGIATAFTFHSGGFPSSDEGQRAKPASLRGFALRRLDAVIAVNQELVNVFAKYGVRKQNLHLIEPSGARVDRDAITQEELPPDLQAFAERHSPLLVAVAQLEPEYGIDVQLAAFPAIRAQYPNAGLMILGWGSLHETLESAIAGHAERNAIMLCGNVPRPKTLALMARADLLLRTTHYDGDALSIREALAMGTRVVATDNGMRPAGVTLMPTLSADALAQAIPVALVAPPSAIASSADNPMDTVLALYDRLAARA